MEKMTKFAAFMFVGLQFFLPAGAYLRTIAFTSRESHSCHIVMTIKQ